MSVEWDYRFGRQDRILREKYSIDEVLGVLHSQGSYAASLDIAEKKCGNWSLKCNQRF